jgi:ubiquinone/menaquinone biosynthesis C-methylase UbiE
MAAGDRISFSIIRLFHEKLYGLTKDPGPPLKTAGLTPGQTVLEVGCGPGFFTIPASEMLGDEGRLVAIDVNPYAVEHVQRKLAAAGVTNASAHLADATATGFEDGSFDAVFVFGLPRARGGGFDGLWPELHRVLRPGGTLAFEGSREPPAQLFTREAHDADIYRYRRSD